jgi:hypothetical protein
MPSATTFTLALCACVTVANAAMLRGAIINSSSSGGSSSSSSSSSGGGVGELLAWGQPAEEADQYLPLQAAGGSDSSSASGGVAGQAQTEMEDDSTGSLRGTGARATPSGKGSVLLFAAVGAAGLAAVVAVAALVVVRHRRAQRSVVMFRGAAQPVVLRYVDGGVICAKVGAAAPSRPEMAPRRLSVVPEAKDEEEGALEL